jgi:hypothetical protein
MPLASRIDQRFKIIAVSAAYPLGPFGPDVAYGYPPYGVQKT